MFFSSNDIEMDSLYFTRQDSYLKDLGIIGVQMNGIIGAIIIGSDNTLDRVARLF
jgi:hypothetical protein